MNQTGTLGTNLRGSLIYVGGTTGNSNVSVITAGTVGIQDRVTVLTLTSGGSGYYVGAGIATTYTSIVPTSIGPKIASGLTVSLTLANVPVPTTKASTPGTGYPTGAFTVTGGTAGASGLEGTIDSVTGGGATGPINLLTITRGGQGYSEDDVLVIVAGDGINGSITLATAPNGEINALSIAVGGEGYAVGDIITIAQDDSGLNATCRVDAVRSFSPVLGDAIVFNNVPVGTVLPVYVDYVVNTGTNATLLVAGRESDIT